MRTTSGITHHVAMPLVAIPAVAAMPRMIPTAVSQSSPTMKFHRTGRTRRRISCARSGGDEHLALAPLEDGDEAEREREDEGEHTEDGGVVARPAASGALGRPKDAERRQ